MDWVADLADTLHPMTWLVIAVAVAVLSVVQFGMWVERRDESSGPGYYWLAIALTLVTLALFFVAGAAAVGD